MRSLPGFGMALAAAALLANPVHVLAQSWSSLASMNNVRFEASAVQYKDDIFVFNGFKQGSIESSVEQFDAGTKQWTIINNTSVAQGTAVTHNGLVRVGNEAWLIGGRIGSHPGIVTSNVWIFNLDSKTWRTGPQLPIPGAAGGAALVNNKIHWFGGLDVNANCDVSNHFVYDLNMQSAGWQNITGVAAMPSPRNHFSTAVHNGIIYAIGGQLGHDSCPGKGGIDVNLVHAFNPSTNTWSAKAGLPANQSHAEGATFVYQNAIYMIGGKLNGNKVFRFDPQNNNWDTVMTLPNALLAPVARVIDNQLIVSSGGSPNYLSPTNLTLSTDVQPLLLPGTVVTEQVVISLEAEYFDTNDSSATHQWINNILSGASNDASMITTPNSGALSTTSANNPTLGYYAYFNEPGTWYLWIRGWGDTNSGVGNNDSLHAGLNGVLSTSADKIDSFPAGWNWSGNTEDGVRASIDVPAAGIHMVNLWMREDGLSVDKFILTNDPDYQPNGTGPVHFDGADSNIPVPTEPTIWSDSYSVNGQCYCDSNYDHGISTTSVLTNQGSKLVPQICADISTKYGTGPTQGRIYYNTVQCGYGPANDIPDETDCPGIPVATGNYTGPRCEQKGATWNLDLLYPTLEPDDLHSPEVLITTPGVDNTMLLSNVVFAGTATDSGEAGFDNIRISLYNITQSAWYDFNGGFSNSTVIATTSLSNTTTGFTNWTYSVTGLPASNYRLYVQAGDNAGNDSTWIQRTFTVQPDTRAPGIVIDSPTSGTALPSSTIFSGVSYEAGGAGFKDIRISLYNITENTWFDFNGGFSNSTVITTTNLSNTTSNFTNWAYSVVGLPAANYRLYAQARDNAGNDSIWLQRKFNVPPLDTYAPGIVIESTTSGVSLPFSATFSGVSYEAGVAGFNDVRISLYNITQNTWYDFNGGFNNSTVVVNANLSNTTSNFTDWSYSVTGLPAAAYRLYAQARDNAGNDSIWIQRTFNIEPDTQAPGIVVSTPTNGALLPSSTVFSGVSYEAGGAGFNDVRISLYNITQNSWYDFNGGFSNSTVIATTNLSNTSSNFTDWTYSVKGLPVSTYRLYAQARDNAGNDSIWIQRTFNVSP